LSCSGEDRRRIAAAAFALALCAVVAGMVGEGLRLLTTAYRVQHARVALAGWTIDPPPAVERAVPATDPRAQARPMGFVQPVRRLQLSEQQALAVVRSGGFPYRGTVLRAASRYAVDPALIFAIIASESKGNPEAVSPSGAIGLMQLMPTTALELGVDPWKPEENIEGAVRYLSALLEQFKSVDLSLVAYNAGPGFAERYRQGEVDLHAETRAFIVRVAGLQ
jgi:soluble lytic murein transglycosylase-like protein